MPHSNSSADLLDQKLPALQSAAETLNRARPATGWIKAVRKALGMSAMALGRRLRVSHATVIGFEKAERTGRIQLSTLQRIAEALDAEVVVALVPRRLIKEQLRAQAQKLAREELAAVNTTMALEDQKVSDAMTRRHYDELVETLLKEKRTLWR